MADVFDKRTRSRVMSRIPAKGNKGTEARAARIFREEKITGWRRHAPLPGKPDFIFRKERVALFIDGCFWHCCPRHGRFPDDNPGYWIPKLQRNATRDRRVNRLLRSRGWRVLRIWEHDLRVRSRARFIGRVRRFLNAAPAA